MPCIIIVLIVVCEREAPSVSAVDGDEVVPGPVFAASPDVIVKVEPDEC